MAPYIQALGMGKVPWAVLVPKKSNEIGTAGGVAILPGSGWGVRAGSLCRGRHEDAARGVPHDSRRARDRLDHLSVEE